MPLCGYSPRKGKMISRLEKDSGAIHRNGFAVFFVIFLLPHRAARRRFAAAGGRGEAIAFTYDLFSRTTAALPPLSG